MKEMTFLYVRILSLFLVKKTFQEEAKNVGKFMRIQGIFIPSVER